jgi:hypothetical protein
LPHETLPDETLPAEETLAVTLPLPVALPFAGAANAVSVKLIPESGAKARIEATRPLKMPRRTATKFITSFPSARSDLAWKPRVVNKRSTVEMGRLHGPEVEIACNADGLAGYFTRIAGNFPGLAACVIAEV